MGGERARDDRSGRLVLVVGPSGAGKDALLGRAEAACADDPSVVFPRRVVTRQSSAHEPNETLTADDFARAVVDGAFALHWQAHGLSYGVRRAMEGDLAAGRTVVVNVSRTVVAHARQTYTGVTAVLITAPPEVLLQRLASRNRDSDGRLDDRLNRAVDTAAFAPDVIINNVGALDDHARELLAAIRGEAVVATRRET
ncbi:phosphonate metabolism protein/1,5-bisphosphokinase (PRPP-forming) PhnN [Bradyrhizobium sp. U87765 SZCCT0131]|uniref:phosphonate metabolism protein/1,5-bisphosphokinase (PRPP-forming) PhnN n=1 Tax=unclassified Bradyrhizobium TaxID=2631580 RepID=UPI001BA9BB43|nr:MULTISPECIES: phosphonate metabolism protein/1,5-bisphosphokinase (PRPP-forming) PhnN [unclassified Bradyrhizobium]MBR1217549.1 phosphonate metabolism protein/1,5-bisphosphokinase (PRPP-forming) PhnN [Bradyrhizobium sp. U87765 SZCCT0131]MBR1264853.1 phosphonate metabolism protein/1,5-bisphosphokinase (PRPP-forming) PhnN [Bradyrhizobium sp. U87765 SZCCT0134]MBR1304835.1 phosphonate metabolism protein/1,5-bisphosphokinase (PRPP-forming) PhnN [Bradyrhizobium sp. U87765 SZCCT0110]MBR1320622.1 ph